MEIIKVIAVILAVFLHHGNGRVITSTSNDNIERMLGLVEEELNTALNETNGKSTERRENTTDLLILVEPDLPSQEALQSSSDDVSGESAIPTAEATIIWRHKRSVDSERDCYTDKLEAIPVLKSDGTWHSRAYPVCRDSPHSDTFPVSTACFSSINNQQKCIGSNLEAVMTKINGNLTVKAFPTSCSCAP